MYFASRSVLCLCRVLGQVSCELVSPKLNRATEGILFFNLELSQMAAPAFEPGRYLHFLLTWFSPETGAAAGVAPMPFVTLHDVSPFLSSQAVRPLGEAESSLGKMSKEFKVYRH